MTMVMVGCWSYGKHRLVVAKWHLASDPAKELNKMALVWVKLPGLPLEFWYERILKSIGNSFGHL